MKRTGGKCMKALLLALVLVMAFAVMPASAGSPNIVVRQYIQADVGGTIQGGGLTIDIPPNALPRDAMVTMRVSLDQQVVQFNPDLDFNVPVHLRFSFQVTQLFYWDRSQWVPVALSGDSATLAHFSRYAWW